MSFFSSSSPDPSPAPAAAGPNTLEQRYKGFAAAKGSTDANTLTNNLVKTILEFALLEGASDIHLEPQEAATLVRYRIDGVLKDRLVFSKNDFPAAAQLRVMAGFSPQAATAYTPEDGGFEMVFGDRHVRFRVSAFPSMYGDQLVIRILDMGPETLSLDHLGFAPETLALLKSAIKSPSGIFYVCGITGGGKTTTLCSILKALTKPETSIMTLEDPIEYKLPRVTQSKINVKAGFTFADGLRSILRQDPNVIMVGEVRDRETAEIATRAALTGHLIFTTIHTISSLSVFARLIDMGIEPALVSGATIGALAQRLVRRVCKDCVQPASLDPNLVNKMFPVMDPEMAAVLRPIFSSPEAKFVKAVGCPACGGSGYRGRIGIFELLLLNGELRALVSAKAPIVDLRRAAIRGGLKTLLMDGIAKAAAGLTTLDEVSKAVAE